MYLKWCQTFNLCFVILKTMTGIFDEDYEVLRSYRLHLPNVTPNVAIIPPAKLPVKPLHLTLSEVLTHMLLGCSDINASDLKPVLTDAGTKAKIWQMLTQT